MEQNIRYTSIVALGGFLMGFDASVISGVVKFIEPEFVLSKIELGWAVASLTLSATLAMMLAVSARQSVKLTQKEFARLLNVSVDSVQDWEQGRRSPRGATRTLLRVVHEHPDVLEQLAN